MTMLEALLRLAAAVLIGGAIGLNRNLHAKATGVRTLGLVALGSALGTMAAASIGGPGDASRAMQGILTGIGFLGAGVIIRNAGHTRIHGLTTAASTWLTACFGIACGAADWTIIAPAFVLALLVLLLGGPLERFIKRHVDEDEEPPRPLPPL